MAELDDKLLKNLDATLQNMNTHLQNLESTLRGVKGGIDATFNPAIIKSFSDEIRGLKAARIIEADKSVSEVAKIKTQIKELTYMVNTGMKLEPVSLEQLERYRQRLEEIELELDKVAGKRLKGQEWLDRQSLYKERDKIRDILDSDSPMVPVPMKKEEIDAAVEALKHFEEVYKNIRKGEQQRSVELANIQQKEKNDLLKQEEQLNKEIADEEEKRNKEALQRYKEEKAYADDVEKRRHKTKERELNEAFGQHSKQRLEAEKRMNQAIQQQIQYYRQLHTLYKGYKDLQAKPNKTKEDIAILEQTKQKILEILRLSKQLELENKGSRQAGINATNFQRLSDNLRNASKETKTLKANLNNLLPTLQRLASAFGVAFSVRGLAQFGKKLIETRGEFEMQFVAMKQIIGDVDAATKIWNQTMQQALQSPFKAMQLVTYTKQLAAYRIETEKLFDTTKRLADVSAGLGVDMQRLILAYGQVKAANFLRASEIRQFTEAGVNILGELSKYFTEIEGRAVSTAQVMERVTKRMVTFADVEEIFKRMTDEGGQFFEMQEVQADTVKGQINKLHDAYDQMLNTIGKANQGTLKNMISALNRIIRNWDKVVARLKVITGLFVTYKVAQATAAIQMIKAGKAADAQSLGISGLTARLVNLIAVEKSTTESTLTLSAALKQLNSSKGGWIGVAVSAALTAAIAIADYYKRAHQLSKDLSQITTDTQIRARKSTTDYEQMAEKIRDVNTSEKERKDTLSKLKRMYEDILPARMLEIEYITKEGNAYNDAKESIRAYYEEKRKQEALDKVYETYSKDVTDNQEHFASVIADIINKQTGLAVSTREINIVIDELVERFKKGEVSAQNYFEVLNQLLNTQIGVTIDREKLSKTGEGIIETFGDAVKLDEWAKGFLESVSTLDEKLEEAGANATEFGKSIKDALDTKVFDEVEKSIEKDAKALSDATFNEELDFEVSNYEKRAREAFEAFKTTFKEEYDKNPQFFEDQFEIKLKFNLEEKGIQYAKDDIEKQGKAIEHSVIDNQKTINSEIEKLAEQTSISDKEILRQFQVDTSVEFDKWIQNQLSKIDLYKTDLLRIQKGLTSDMTDEHIAMLQTLEPFLPLWEKYLKGLTPEKKTKTTRTTHESASKLISLIKEMRSEYDKLSKSAYGYAKSEEKVRESYKDSVKEILGKAGITDYDFTTNEGMIKALEKVKSYATKLGKDAAAEVQKYIDQLETEIEINAQVRIREDFGKQMEKAFSDYELTLELDKLNISPEAAKDWLNFDYTSLGDMLNAMNDFANKLIEKNDFDEEDAKTYQQWAKKIEDQIYKARKEKAKEYSKYLETELSERAKLEMEYAKKVAEVKASPVFQGEQQDAILNNMNREFNEKLQELTWKSFKESDFYVEMMEDLTSIPAEYSALMLTKLNEILMHPEKLTPRALKEAINARQKIMEARRQMNPALAMSENLRSYRDFYTNQGNREEFGLSAKTSKAARKEIQALIIDKSKELSQLEEEINIYDDLIGEIENYNNLKKEYDEKSQGLAGDPEEEISQRQELLECLEYEQQRYEDLRDAKQRGEEIDEEEFNSLAKEINVRQQNITQLNAEIKAYRDAEVARKALGTAYANLSENAQNLIGGGEIQIGSTSGITSGNIKSKRQATSDKKDNTKSAIQRLKEARKNEVEFAKAWHEFNAQLNNTIGKVKDMGNAFYDTYEALGGETDALTEGWKEFGSTMIDAITSALTMIPTLVTGFTAAGVAINSAMGIIGLIAEAIQLVLVLITGLAKLHDAGYEKEIENQQKIIDNLQRAYDRLEKQIEKTWDTASYIRTYNEETQNLYAQIEALNKQIAAENAKKDTDADKIQGYKDSIRDAEDELEELKQKQIEVFGGIGEEGYRDAAQEFVDAWKSAFLETGDGLQGLQDHFDEFLNDWFVKQATMRYASAALEPVFKMIDDAVSPNGAGGANVLMQELENIKEWARVNFPQISDTLEEISRPFIGDGEGSLSGLAAGIQGMTEEQANILEAYWNSVRGYTASIDMNVARIAEMLGAGGVNTNPQLQQLNLIAANTQATHQLLQSVTKSGHSQGGYGIKVFAD